MSIVRFAVCFLAGLSAVGCQPGQPNQQYAERHEAYRDAKTARVVVQESYNPYQGLSLPFREYVNAWLRIANVAVTDDASQADFTITVVVEGGPLKARYGQRTLYAGARLAGTIRIERSSRHREEVVFSGIVEPPRDVPAGTVIDRGLPEDAPFYHAHPAAFDGFSVELAGLMGRYFGKSVLLIALDDYGSKGILRVSAVEALAALGDPAVPYLVDAFIYCSPEAEKGLGEALERITGEKFGSSARKWTEWFEKRKRTR